MKTINEIKQCNLDIVVKVKCPSCGSELIADLNSNYLSYPVVGHKDTISFYCEKCDENEKNCDYSLPIKIVSSELATRQHMVKWWYHDS